MTTPKLSHLSDEERYALDGIEWQEDHNKCQCYTEGALLLATALNQSRAELAVANGKLARLRKAAHALSTTPAVIHALGRNHTANCICPQCVLAAALATTPASILPAGEEE